MSVDKKIQIITSYSLNSSYPVRNRLLSTINSYLDLGCKVQLCSADKKRLHSLLQEILSERFTHNSCKIREYDKANFFLELLMKF